mmetsp:Transcript_9003/g.29573  ORF Transcript_9003/g.29573 Transcript_9003/m.29573 type:complete len:102 (+) Transcript_9003:190-495(+)
MKSLKSKYPSLSIYAFPSQEFGGQELKDAAAIKDFVNGFDTPCTLMQIGPINGNPVFEELKKSHPGDVTWNFAAWFLLDANNTPVSRSKKPPSEAEVEAVL